MTNPEGVPTPPPSSWSRAVRWTAAALLLPPALAALGIALFGWNWLRGPIERVALQQTGRALVIGGDLGLHLAWPLLRLHAGSVSFANPSWAQEPQMVRAQSVDVAVDLPQLLQRKLAFPEVRLKVASVFLEQGSAGRKSWLLDLQQQDEGARIPIGSIAIEQGTLGYDDAAQTTHIRAQLATQVVDIAGAAIDGLSFKAQGQYQGLVLRALGSGGPVLALRDDSKPYALKIDASVGRTGVQGEGTVTGALKLSEIDMRMSVHGDSLDQLFPLLGIAFPATHAYRTEGRLLHRPGLWRYQAFTGRIGESDIAGSLQVQPGAKRALLSGELNSRLLDLDDLGPVIGARTAKGSAAPAPRAKAGRVLPDLPFRTERWHSVDAQVRLHASTLRRAKALPLENLVVNLGLHDALLTLDPLQFGIAAGRLDATLSLDGRSAPIQAEARIQASKLQLGKLFPTVDLNRNSIGLVNGRFDLTGRGNSVAEMLASSSGKASLLVSGGRVSQLMMERAGLHLWEMLALRLSGDRLVKLRCAVADFDVVQGRMQAAALVLDTEVTTILGSGSIDLSRETLDLTLNQKTKNTSPLALRSPIHIGGSFAQPEVGVDKARMAARAVGAVALSLLNPVLALVPLVDAGPGQDSDCAQLVRSARAARAVPRKSAARR